MGKYHFNSEVKIGNKIISNDSPCFIIAEAGVNHNGDFNNAIKLIDIAEGAGVDAVKFQHFDSDELILKDVEMASYQKVNTESSDSQYEMLKKLELSIDELKKIKDYSESKGLIFLCTPFDYKSFVDLEKIGTEAYKISSTDFTNLNLIKSIASTNKPTILSTGMCAIPEIDTVMDFISELNRDLILLHCTTNYPTSPKEVNLSVLNLFKSRYNCLIGFSDHTEGIGASPFSIQLGATVIEKHYTIDKEMPGPDHVASLNPTELKEFVKSIRYAEEIMGSDKKIISDIELSNKARMQKCIVAKTPINKGDVFSESNLTTKRTGGKGISAIEFYNLIGKSSSKDLKPNEIVYER